MESEKNIISSEAKLSAIASVMFFSPFVKNNLKNEDFSEEEKIFVYGYVQIGFLNLCILAIVLLAALVNVFDTYSIVSWIINVGGLIIFIISIFSIFACVNEIPMWGPDETINQNIQNKGQLLKVYIPVMNFIIRSRQTNYNMPYRWLKESILLRNIFIFGTLILGNYFGLGVIAVIAVRVGLLLINIDIIPLSIKKAINSLFLCNPGETFAYLFAPIISKIKKSDYQAILQARKQLYAQGQNFGIGILMQYALFISILFLIYHEISISLYDVVLLFAAFLRIIRIIIFYKYKNNIQRIPILSEIVSLVFH